ncbi:MAG: hypothetical protein DDT40_01666 [candidate division WS2 bacterium]|nr:hypothetical protein [Candidatus Psychracetigena formicireducens]
MDKDSTEPAVRPPSIATSAACCGVAPCKRASWKMSDASAGAAATVPAAIAAYMLPPVRARVAATVPITEAI